MEMNKSYKCNNYQSRNLIGHFRFWVISPRNLSLFTRPFFAGRCVQVGYETRGQPRDQGNLRSPKINGSRICGCNLTIKSLRRERSSDQAHFLPIKELDHDHKCFNRQHLGDYPLMDGHALVDGSMCTCRLIIAACMWRA